MTSPVYAARIEATAQKQEGASKDKDKAFTSYFIATDIVLMRCRKLPCIRISSSNRNPEKMSISLKEHG